MSDPIATIIEAFQTHPIVAVGEGPHGNLQGHAFRLALIRDARFAASVQNVVVESGNALYQALMDRFTSGEDVPSSLLRAVWQNTTQNSPVWDRPIYEELFREVRARNRDLPEERRLRVLLGDPPVDWTKVLAGGEELGPFVRSRDRHAAAVLSREVLARGQRALVIYGDAHLSRTPGGESLVSRLAEQAPGTVFTIVSATTPATFELLTTLAPESTSWPVPSLTTIRGTVLDTRQFAYYDAVLYLGAPSRLTFSELSAALCQDSAYVAMRVTRMRLLLAPGVAPPEQQMEQACSRSRP